MRTRKTGVSLLVSVLLLGTVTFAVANAQQEKASSNRVFKIGTILAMTGPGSFYGKAMSQGQMLAIDEINASRELPFKLELVITDHQSGDTTATVSGLMKMLDLDKCDWVTSSYPQPTLAAQSICARRQIPLVNGGGIAPNLINLPYLHNTRIMVDVTSRAALKYISEKTSWKRIALVNWTMEGDSMPQVVAQQCKEFGLDLVSTVSYTDSKQDYAPEISKARALNPDVYILLSGEHIAKLINQARDMGIDKPLVSIIDLTPDQETEVGPKNLEGCIVSMQYFDRNSTVSWAQHFTKAYEERFPGSVAEMFAANYYEMTYVLRDCIKYVLSKNQDPFVGANLEAAIKAIKYFPTLFGEGKMELKDDGSVNKVATLFVYKGGKLVNTGFQY